MLGSKGAGGYSDQTVRISASIGYNRTHVFEIHYLLMMRKVDFGMILHNYTLLIPLVAIRQGSCLLHGSILRFSRANH